MKRLVVLILVGAMACLAFATENSKPVDNASSLPLSVKAIGPAIVETAVPTLSSEMTLEEVAAFEALKTRYYDLLDRAVLGMATAAELTELNDLSATMGWEAFSEEVRGEEGSLDQGSTDTLSNCASATVIPSVPYSDSGLLDGDNDCSVVSASPSNEVFYTFTPTVSGSYFIRAARTGTTAAVAAVRVMSGGCCLGATSVAFSSGTVGTDCGELASRVTYLRADLVAGTQYWIHVGSSSATVSTESYDFSIVKSPDCPVDESSVAHGTCATAQFISIGDSVLGDSALSASPDWYQIVLTRGDSIRIDVYGRAAGSCLSGSYPGISGAFVDARFSFWSSCSGLAADSLGGDDVGSHGIVTCSEDAAQAFCLNPGTYYIKVYNFGVQPYILKTTSLGPCTTAPVACETLSPCGSPAEIEPNGTCADAANILRLECTGGPYYGVLCPGTERDYWYVPATTGTMQTTVLLSDGPNCSTFPPTILGMRVATTAAGLCTTPSGSFAGGFVFGGCTPWPGGWVAVDRAISAGQSVYSLSVSCGEFACPCPTYSGPNHGQACASCLGKFPTAPGSSTGPASFFQTVIPQYQIIDIDVCLAATHTYVGDIEAYLISPWADTVKLIDNRGSSGDNLYVTTFDDEAATSIATGVAPFNGSFIPEEALSALDGFNAAGTWELYIFDTVSGDSGYVHCWCLNFTYDVILSVELASFTAVAGDGNVTLNWATASESDNDHFTVERNGETMANVEATNNSSGSNYTWTDNTVVNGTPYEYSLYAVDANGARELLGTVAATPESDGSVVTEYALHQNYPNPFNPTTNIAFDMVEAGNVSISIFNVMGQKVAEIVNGNVAAGRHVVSFDATGLSSGLYLYKMEANGFTAQAKMVLMK